MKSIKVEVKKMPNRIDEIVSDAKETMDDTIVSLKKAARESLEDADKKPKLRRETFENSSRMQKFMERHFLLVLITIVQVSSSGTLSFPHLLSLSQTIIILLMLGLLVFLGSGLPAAAPQPSKESVDWLR